MGRKDKVFNPTLLLAEPVGDQLENFTQVEGISEEFMDALGNFFHHLNARDGSYVSDDVCAGWKKIPKESKKILREHFSDAEIFALGVTITRLHAMAQTFINEQLTRGILGKITDEK